MARPNSSSMGVIVIFELHFKRKLENVSPKASVVWRKIELVVKYKCQLPSAVFIAQKSIRQFILLDYSINRFKLIKSLPR